jgi:predicted DNA-binding transcriptional regulator AlpA
MSTAGLSIPRLAAETKRIDPEGGLSPALVGFVVGSGISAREECSDRAAHLIAEALGAPVDSLFETDHVVTATESTSTERASVDMTRTATAPAPIEQMITVRELAQAIKKSRAWIYLQIRDRDTNGFPVEYAGNAPRFVFSEVRAWMRADAIRAGRLAA